jgi:hypothetical protein
MTVPPPPQSVNPAPAKKKGMGALAWVGIGCLVLVLLGIGTCYGVTRFVKQKAQSFMENPEMGVAKAIVMANPEWELVSSDDQAKTLTVRNKKTAEEMTVNIDDIQSGKIEFKTKEGTSTVDVTGGSIQMTDEQGRESNVGLTLGKQAAMPDWVPVPDGADVRQVFTTSTGTAKSGSYIVTSDGSIDEVASFYEAGLKAAGFEVEKSTASLGGALNGATVSAKIAGGRRSVNVGITDFGGKARAMVSFEERQ